MSPTSTSHAYSQEQEGFAPWKGLVESASEENEDLQPGLDIFRSVVKFAQFQLLLAEFKVCLAQLQQYLHCASRLDFHIGGETQSI